jgi:hypothetical protein
MELVIERAGPLIVVIRRFDAANGHAPKKLEDLVPTYIDRIPATGLSEPFEYGVRDREPRHWRLTVRLFGFRHLAYDSTGHYELTGRPIRYGWVVLDP